MHDIISISWMPHRKKKWCNGAWQKRTPRSGAKWSKAPRPLNQLYWHCRHCFSSSPKAGLKARGRIVLRSDLKPRDDGGGGEFVVENRDRYQPGLGSQPERAVALGWKEVDYFLFFLPIARPGFGELQRTIEAHVDWTPATCRGARHNRNWMI